MLKQLEFSQLGRNDDERPVDDNSHQLPVCDVTVEESEMLYGGKLQRYVDGETDDDTDSEWEVEEN